jgi:S1-C subfamily serine protease
MVRQYVQTGNSDGPILNDRGNVVGVAVAKLDIKKILKD